MLLKLEEYAIRKDDAPRRGGGSGRRRGIAIGRSAIASTGGFDRQSETLPELRADVVIPCPRFQQILIRLWGPDDRECQGFLKQARPDLAATE